MPNENWKCLALLCCVAALAATLLIISLPGLAALPTSDWLMLAGLLVLTVGAGRFTVPVTEIDGTGQSHKSLADAIICVSESTRTPPMM